MFWDFIYPKRCIVCGRGGKYFCDECRRKIKKDDEWIWSGWQPELEGLLVGLRYGGVTRKGVHLLKYRFYKQVGEDLRADFLMSIKLKLVDSRGAEWRAWLKQKPTMVPVPLYWQKANWRGFNQAEMIARWLAEEWGFVINNSLVERVKATKPQAGLKKKGRRENVRGAFAVKDKPPKRVLLVDDVWTTGETMKELARELKKAGANEVRGVTLAR